MSKREILAGSADQTIDIFVPDSSSTVGAGLTGLVFNTAGLTCYYRKGATGTPTALTLATQTVGGAHSDGGFVAVDGTNCPGQYRLDLSDTIVASAGMVTLYLRGATNMAPVLVEIEVVSVNKFDAVRMGLTALPNANAEAAGGLYTRGTGAGQINQAANGQIDANAAALAAGVITATSIAADAITAAKIADGAIDAATFAAGAINAAAIAADAITDAKVAADVTIASVTGSVGSVTGAVGSVTGNVGGNVTGSVGSVAAGGITASSIADGAIDRATFAADTGLQTIRSNTAQAGAAGTITLDASASATDDFYNDTTILLTGGTGVGQIRRIRDYVGSTKVATIVPNWATNPDATSTFAILPVTSAWDETLADHLDSGSTGAALNAAGAAGDPWSTALPGAYGAGTAGHILGTAIPDVAPGASGGLLKVGANTAAVSFTAGVTMSNASGAGLTLSSSGSNGAGLNASGNGSGAGIIATGGATGNGMSLVGGGTSGDALDATATNGHAFDLNAGGNNEGMHVQSGSGSNRDGFLGQGDGTGSGIAGYSGTGAAAVGILGFSNGTSGNSDGIRATAGTGGTGIRGNIVGNITGTIDTVTTLTNKTGFSLSSTGLDLVTAWTVAITGNITGNLSGSVGSVTGAVGSVTGNVGGNVTGSIGSLATQAKADVNAEVLDVITVDTFAEPSAVPAATSTLKDKLNWVFVVSRNKRTQTSTTELLRNDGDSATVGTSTKSDDGSVFVRGKYT